ncbi:MAG TPA: hypothetical protein PLR46_08810, partial [Ferruginibacter sp.]|nr:hypothetical protein [Ferruginibacter sp.]
MNIQSSGFTNAKNVCIATHLQIKYTENCNADRFIYRFEVSPQIHQSKKKIVKPTDSSVGLKYPRGFINR